MSIVGGTNGRERDGSQVSDGMDEKVAESLVAAQLCVKYRVCSTCSLRVDPLSGGACPPFYRPREEQGLQMGERRKTRGQEAPSKVLSPPFPLIQPC